MSYRKRHILPKIKNLKPKRKLYHSRVFWFSVLLLIIFAVIFYFILFFPKFQISKIDILGVEEKQRDDLEKFILEDIEKKILDLGIISISSKSIFVKSFSKSTKDILVKFPSIENVEIKKQLPNNITVTVKKREYFAIFCEINESCFSIDRNGIIFENFNGNISGTVLKKESKDEELYLGNNAIEKNSMEAIFKIQNNLKDNFQIDIKEVLVGNPLVFKTSEGWLAYFDPEADIDLQITKINVLLNSEITLEDRSNIEYIYLQYKDRAYYK